MLSMSIAEINKGMAARSPLGEASLPSGRLRRLLLAGVLLLACLYLPGDIGYTQNACGNCPGVSNNGFPKCIIVYYTITGFDSNQTSQITAAINAWNQADQTNNAKIKFVPGPVPPNAYGYTLNVRTGTTASGAPADTVKSPPTGQTISATTTFWLQYTIAGTTPPN